MGIFDSLKNMAKSYAKKEASKIVQGAVSDATKAVGKGSNRSESFTFEKIPASVTELQALPEISLDSAFKTTALTVLVLFPRADADIAVFSHSLTPKSGERSALGTPLDAQ